MKSNRIIYLATLLMAMAFGACVKQKIVTPELAEFAAAQLGNTGSYYVTNDPGTVFKVPIGFTTSSNKDRVINFTVTSPTGATAGTQYTVNSSITIPAGKVVDSLPVKGIFSGYPTGRMDTLVLTITGGDAGVFPGSASTYTLILQGYCDVVSADLVGDYTKTTDYDIDYGFAGAGTLYTTNISNWTSTGPTSATIVIKNLGATSDVAFGDAGGASGFLSTDPAAIGLTASLDWSDPSNFTVKIASQPYLLTYGNGPVKISAGGTFSSCAGTFTIKFQASDSKYLYDHVVTSLTR